MNNTKHKFNEVLDHIKSRLDAQNIMDAREEILAEIEKIRKKQLECAKKIKA